MELIPGLPNDISLQCLVRVPYEDFPSLSSVCHSWKAELKLPHFSKHRKATGYSRRVVVMAQARFDLTKNQGLQKYSAKPVIGLTLCDPQTGKWSDLPPVPGYSDGLPMFCQLSAVEYNLVLMGGWDPKTWMSSRSVFVYNFLSSVWRRGAAMPGRPRSFFACASDNNRTVFVAGGHDDDKNALKSAMTYDVADDRWTVIADMEKERDECKGVFHRGKFHVIGGYPTEKQGRFEGSAQEFDAVSWRWNEVQEDFMKLPTCPRSCVDGGNGKLYMCQSDKVVALDGSFHFQVIAALPVEVHSCSYLIPWDNGKLMVMGARIFGEPSNAYLLDLKSCEWRKLDKTIEFAGHAQSHCCMEI